MSLVERSWMTDYSHAPDQLRAEFLCGILGCELLQSDRFVCPGFHRLNYQSGKAKSAPNMRYVLPRCVLVIVLTLADSREEEVEEEGTSAVEDSHTPDSAGRTKSVVSSRVVVHIATDSRYLERPMGNL